MEENSKIALLHGEEDNLEMNDGSIDYGEFDNTPPPAKSQQKSVNRQTTKKSAPKT